MYLRTQKAHQRVPVFRGRGGGPAKIRPGAAGTANLQQRGAGEGLQAAEKDIARYNLTRKRAMSHAIVSVATLTGITVGSVGAPVVDLMILKPTESLEIESIFKKIEKECKTVQTIWKIGPFL